MVKELINFEKSNLVKYVLKSIVYEIGRKTKSNGKVSINNNENHIVEIAYKKYAHITYKIDIKYEIIDSYRKAKYNGILNVCVNKITMPSEYNFLDYEIFKTYSFQIDSELDL